MLLLPVCRGRPDGVPRQSSLPHLAQLVDNEPGAIWHFNTRISVAAAEQGRNYWPKGGCAPGRRVKRTPRKADKPGSVKVREAFGEPSSCQLCSVLPGFSRSLLCLHDSCMVISPRSKLIDCE